MARQRRSGGSFVLVIIIVLASMGAALVMDKVLEKQRAEQQAVYEKEFQAKLQSDYDVVTATVVEKNVNEYDTGDWEYDDEGDTHWETWHVTEYTYTIEYEYNGEQRSQTFTCRDVFPEPGETMEIYVDKLFGEFGESAEFVKK